MNRKKNKVMIFFLLIALGLGFLISISLGPSKIPFSEVMQSLGAKIVHGSKISETAETIIWKVRFPRIFLGMITGAALAVAGVAFQALLRNPLASPYVLGVSSGAALGGTLALFLGHVSLIPFLGFIGAAATIYMVYQLARTGNKIPINALLLAGVVTAAFLGAVISFLMILSGERLDKIYFWLMGSLTETNSSLIVLITLLVILGIGVIFAFAKDLNLLLLGEEPARHLGVNAETVKKVLFLAASLITGAVVSITGMIGFVGLVVPHIIRLMIGPDHRTLIIGSALFGALFLMVADTVARTLLAPVDIPVGVITGIVGGPFFLFLLQRKKRGL